MAMEKLTPSSTKHKPAPKNTLIPRRNHLHVRAKGSHIHVIHAHSSNESAIGSLVILIIESHPALL